MIKPWLNTCQNTQREWIGKEKMVQYKMWEGMPKNKQSLEQDEAET